MGRIESVNPKSNFGDTEAIGSGSKSPIGSDGHTTRDFAERGAAAYAQTKAVVSDTYDQTTDVLNGAYKQVLVYGRQNPGTTMLIAFGAGAGIGLLIAASARKHGRSAYFGEPVVDAISQIASEFMRRR